MKESTEVFIYKKCPRVEIKHYKKRLSEDIKEKKHTQLGSIGVIFIDKKEAMVITIVKICKKS